MVVRVHMTAGRGLIPEAQLCPQGLPFQPCLPLAPRRGSLPAAFAPPSASGGSGPAWPLSGSAGTTLLPATSAAPTPPPGRAETERRNGKGDRAGRRGREKRQVGGRGEEKEKGKRGREGSGGRREGRDPEKIFKPLRWCYGLSHLAAPMMCCVASGTSLRGSVPSFPFLEDSDTHPGLMRSHTEN